MIDESRQLCVGIIATGFRGENDFKGRLKFDRDDITIRFVDHIWRIDDLVNGPSDYISLRELMENEAYRWSE